MISEQNKNFKNCENIYVLDSGKLPSYSWPGCYPLIYLNEWHDVHCGDCANKYIEPQDDFSQIALLESSYHCESCNKFIEGAYTEGEI